MSDLLYTEAPNKDGFPYERGGWRQYAVHDDHNIRGFFGPFRYLSNFYPCHVPLNGLDYPSSECAYQAQKLVPELREPFTRMTDVQSKKGWKLVPEEGRVPNWDEHKFTVMQEVVFSKFLHNHDLRDKLVETEGKYLEESNHWYDKFFGVCIHTNIGHNHLGRILMATRTYFTFLKNSQK